MNTVPITLTATPEQIRALYAQLKQEGLTIEHVSDTQLTVYVTPMPRDEAVAFLVNNR